MTKRIISQEIMDDIGDATREVLSEQDPANPVTTPIKVKELSTAIRSIPYGYYGVRKDRSVSNTALTRLGSPELHRKLPIQSNMRRCVVADDGTVAYYLHPSDSRYKENGDPAKLDGTDGQVMVEIPEHWMKIEIFTDSTTGHVMEDRKISEFNLPGYTKVNKCYYSAFEAALDRTNNKLASVINTTAQYRGGNNTTWDGTYRSLLGMPATSISLTSFRTYAHNRGTGWQCHDNNIYEIVCNLYIIEYANTNCQLAFNASPIASGDWAGCKQGGLGSGVTGMPDWSAYNSYNPVVPCGVTVTLGNATGVVTYNVIASDGSTVKYAAPVPSYRGIENLFGHIWKHTDAILVNIQSAGAGGKSMVYKCTDPTKYSSTLTADYVYVGDEARSEGWTKNVLTPCMVCSEVGADSSTGYADYHYTSIPSSGSSLRAVLFGGDANYGAYAGFANSRSNYDPSSTYARFGSRLCFTPPTT